MKAVTKLVIACSTALALGMILLSWNLADNVSQVRFEPLAWKQADPNSAPRQNEYRTVRSHMINDLLHRYKFEGWTRQQVIDLLGEPTGQWSGFEQWDIVYVLGLERAGAFSLDDEALGFKFDSKGKVIKYGLSVN